MDTFLIDYLKSGNAWLLAGSGPSIAMGYPSWAQLASYAFQLLQVEAPNSDLKRVEKFFKSSDFPSVFEEAFKVLGPDRVLLHLDKKLVPTQRTSKLYDLLAKWPINVYLTTNYDNAITTHLTEIRETYLPYTNSKDHFAYLNYSLKNAIFKIHGDLRSQEGLILTRSQYDAIQNAPQWSYWRDSMAAVFRMQPIIMVGLSLSDPHITHILQAAKNGAGVNQPVCWIAPDVDFKKSQELLYEYRVRVIPYDNRDGTHINLVRLIENISQFVFPRTSQKIHKEIEEVAQSPLGQRASAPGYFVFNKIASQDNYEQYRVSVMCAAIRAIIPVLKQRTSFTLQEALTLAGWPTEFPFANDFLKSIKDEAIRQGIITLYPLHNDIFRVGIDGENKSLEEQRQYDHIRSLFLESLKNRIRRNYSSLSEDDCLQISIDIENSLVGFFKGCGLALSTTFLERTVGGHVTPIPSTVIKFINQAAAKYGDILSRQAFSTSAIDLFTQPEVPDKEYLGRISQGFFAFHALGMFGEAAKERLDIAKSTVWLIDSNLQIPALALAAPTNALFRDCFGRMKELGLRLFTTQKLFEETLNHLWYAEDVIKREGVNSHHIIAAATGQAPYRKANQFLEGFIRWRSAGNPNDWDSYMTQIFGVSKPYKKDARDALIKLGVDVRNLEAWPGYDEDDHSAWHSFETSIVGIWERKIASLNSDGDYDPELLADFHKKAAPEADALVIVTKERLGEYYIISERGKPSPAWFISETSMLNVIDGEQPRITWQPEAFLRFASTLAPSSGLQDANRAFDMLLLSFTQLGVSLIDDKTLYNVFGGIIDEATLRAKELEQQYQELIESKYTEKPEDVLSRMKPKDRPAALEQIQSKLLAKQTQQLQQYQAVIEATSMRATKAENELSKLSKVKQQQEEKKRRKDRKYRQSKSKKK